MNQSFVTTSSSRTSVADMRGTQEIISPKKSSPLRTRIGVRTHAGAVAAWCRRPAFSSGAIAAGGVRIAAIESGPESACISCAVRPRRSFAPATGEGFHGMGRANLH